MTAIQNGDRYTGVAGVDLTGKQYHLVKLDANGEVVLAAAATDNILGTLEVDGRKGEAVSVALANGVGSFKVKLAANTAKDAYLTSDASGQAVVTAVAGDRVIGRLVKAGVAGEIAEYIKHNEKF
ncbi:DUF2190 domain-containing protein [Glutamicibacter halophytocola]|uniref:DUF2190 domain-containing protein n=1 Tax=Glutamicibacter halophytocola TaxID=1933880 RepID=UPI0015C52FDC|nr:DUF2190 domain-containing protein [Glutamicibacter halophytocola]NQD39978.1 DUF2190 domain-containing protein [Glutamicibacter halophytocola]